MSDTTVGKRAVELLVKHGYGPREDIEGCTEEDLKALEDRYDVTLPEAYKSCMQHIGRSSGGFLAGSEFRYPAMRRQMEFANKIVEEHATDFEFPDDIFVFRGVQGYTFNCFRTGEGEDPPVYVFMDFGSVKSGSTYELRQQADSFSEWLFTKIKS